MVWDLLVNRLQSHVFALARQIHLINPAVVAADLVESAV